MLIRKTLYVTGYQNNFLKSSPLKESEIMRRALDDYIDKKIEELNKKEEK